MKTCLLSAKPQSFSPLEEPLTIKCNIYLLPLHSRDIVMIYGTQIFQFDAETMEIKDEIVLEASIHAFSFANSLLTLKLERISGNKSEESLDTNTILFTVTSKSGSWSFDCPSSNTISLNFTNSKLSCSPESLELNLQPHNCAILEVIKDNHVAKIFDKQLQILDKDKDREIISSAPLLHLSSVQGLIWINESILVFTVSDDLQLKVAKYNFMQIISPTNGCNWPLVTWSKGSINVHRTGAICPTWYVKLKNSEVWDVLDSPIGSVQDVQVSADGSCLLVCADGGVAFCDFISRSWKSLPFSSLLYPKWLGNKHVVALTPDTRDLILISDDDDVEIMKIPVKDPQNILIIDTYNNWQLLLQTEEEISIYAFDNETISFTFCKTIPFPNPTNRPPLKQMAYLKENIFTLNHLGEFLINNERKLKGVEAFLVLASGHILLARNDKLLLFKDEENIHEIKVNRPIAVFSLVNCLPVFHFDPDSQLNFSLSTPLQSRFLLSDLFFASGSCELLVQWAEDPLYPLALEYVLLGSLGNGAILKSLEESHQDKTVLFSKAIVSLTRKIEVNDATTKLFKYFKVFTPKSIVNTFCNDELFDHLINFLPYLAKSDHKEEIITVLELIFTRINRFSDQIEKVKEYLNAFEGLSGLFDETIRRKIESLWTTNRPLKAYKLMKYCTSDISLPEISIESDYYRIESVLFHDLVTEFEVWFQGRKTLT